LTTSANRIRITVDVVVPVYCEEKFGWDPLMVGMFLLTFYGPCLLCIYTGRLADRYDGRWLAIGGFLGCVPCFLGLAMVDMVPGGPPILMWVLMACAGISLSIANTPVMAEVVYTLVSKQDEYPILRRNSGGYGLAYGMFMTVFSLGSATASAGSPPILETEHGWRKVLYSLAAVCVVTVIPVAIWTGAKRPGGRMGMRKPSQDIEMQDNVVSSREA
jgi:MFS family permease